MKKYIQFLCCILIVAMLFAMIGCAQPQDSSSSTTTAPSAPAEDSATPPVTDTQPQQEKPATEAEENKPGVLIWFIAGIAVVGAGAAGVIIWKKKR